ncbi:DUF962 domain protein [Zopfochytrium polystomum]|nr:DUF962 domain protein [Zopfochytrium polystomum]
MSTGTATTTTKTTTTTATAARSPSSKKRATLSSDLRDAFDLMVQFPKYAEYHHNRVNQLIHITCVPIILWTSMVWFANIPAFAAWPLDAVQQPLNATVLLTAFYATYYLILDPLTGALILPLLALLCHTATRFQAGAAVAAGLLPADVSPNAVAGVVHATAWCFQFLGHGVAERRAPALLDNLLQAVVLAPFFVFLEVLFSLGYRPQLAKDFEKVTVERIKAWKAASSVKAE